MRQIQLGSSGFYVPTMAVGCMRINALSKAEAAKFINTSMELGANFFDHADIYAAGAAESLFAEAIEMTPRVREKIVIQTKCGIRPGVAFDFSKGHILASVECSLKRLKTDYIDVLLLHRPDALVEPEEVAEAFDTLRESGKVRHFGVSNQNPMQMALLQKYVKQPLVANQLQFGVMHAEMVSAGTHVNMQSDDAIVRDGSVLDYCRLKEITIQPWSPFQFGFFAGAFVGNEKFPELNAKLEELAQAYNTSPTAIAFAWILRHPAKMQPVTGTMNLTRLQDCAKATEITLTRDEWYAVHMVAGNTLP